MGQLKPKKISFLKQKVLQNRELQNKRQLDSTDFTKYQILCNNKIFITEKLTSKNETLAFHERRLKCSYHIFFC